MLNQDRLYCLAPASPARRSAQALLFRSAVVLAYALAPVTPHLAQLVFANLNALVPTFPTWEASTCFSPTASTAPPSIERTRWPSASARELFGELEILGADQLTALVERFEYANKVRSALNTVPLSLRTQPPERLALHVDCSDDPIAASHLRALASDTSVGLGTALTEVLRVAEVEIAEGAPPRARTKDFKGPFSIDVVKAKLYFSQSENARCGRCRRYCIASDYMSSDSSYCSTCVEQLKR